jgi:EmrB/QacA subfamily drug resistance transporter
MAVLGLAFLIMMVAVDQTVVGTALPTVIAELKGFELYAWVATAYLLTSVITVPIFGRLGDYYGRKPFVVASILIFTAASVGCGLAQTMMQLVLGRAAQGLGGGMLIGTAFACIPDLFPDPRTRLRWQIILSSAFGIANAFGPTLGGFLTQYVGWRFVFFVNVPLGMISLYFVWRYLPYIRQSQPGKHQLDWLGALLVMGGLGSLQLFVEFFATRGLSGSTLLCASVALIAFVCLVIWERRCPEPLIPMHLFSNKGLAALFTLSCLVGVIMFVLLFYLPLLLQGGFGLDPREVGVLITPMVVCITVGSLTGARIVLRLPRPSYILYCGFILLVVACAGLATIGHISSRSWLNACMIMAGIGLGFVMPNLTVFVQELAGRSMLGISTGLLQSIRMIGGMLGTTVVGSIVSQYYAVQVRSAVQAPADASWFAMLMDPQVLVNQATQSAFIAELQRAVLQGDSYLEAARQALVTSIHTGLFAIMAVAVLGVFWVYRVPLIHFSRARPATADTKPDAAP